MDEESLTAYVTQHRENTKWIPLMVTNVDIQLVCLGVSMGAGELPQFIKTHNCIVGLEKDRHGSLYQDNLCGVRCLAFHLNFKETGDGYRGLEVRTKDLKQQWRQGGLDLLRVPEFEDAFNISVDIYSLCEDGSVIPRYLGEGLGRVMKNIMRHDTPILKQAGSQALKAGISVLAKGVLGNHQRKTQHRKVVQKKKKAVQAKSKVLAGTARRKKKRVTTKDIFSYE